MLLGYGICGSYSGITVTVFVWEVMSHSLVDRSICARLQVDQKTVLHGGNYLSF